MRWWLYDGKKTTGPFTKEDLARVSSLSPEAPLCREYLLGTADEVWFRAVDVKEIASIFPPAILKEAAENPQGTKKPGPWPPDPTGRDIDTYGSVERRMQIVDTIIGAAQDRITLRTERFQKLQAELDKRLETADMLQEKIQTMAVKFGGLAWVKEELDQSRAAMAMQHKRISELNEQIKKLEEAPLPEPPPAPEPPPPPPAPEPLAAEPLDEVTPSRRRKRKSRRRVKRKSASNTPISDPFGSDLPNAEFKANPPEPF